MGMWRRLLIVGGYISYTVVLFALFAYLTFPSQRAGSLIRMALSRYGLEHVRIGAVQPLLPAGLAFQEVSISREVNGQTLELVRFPKLHLYLGTLLPFINPLHFRFAGDLYGGHLLGSVQWEENGAGPTVGIQANLQDFRPAIHPMAAMLGAVTLDGSLTGAMTLQIPESRWHQGEGRLVIQGEAGGVSGIELMGMRLPPLAYEQLTGELRIQPQSVIVRDFLVRGKDWQVQAQGEVNLTEHLPQSPVDMTLHIRTSEALGQQLGIVGTMLKQRRDPRGFASFKVGGTLGKPSMQL
jgi:type II secretion system protein N